jgi:outer membrane protein assembly factor BamB
MLIRLGLSVVFAVLLLTGCGQHNAAVPLPEAGAGPLSVAPAQSTPTTMPQGLPRDGVQPWEATDIAGHVPPPGRNTSSATGQGIFAAGQDTFAKGGSAVAVGDACRLTATTHAQGAPALAYATYRLPLGGTQPGMIALDVNPLGPASSYYVGLSDYGTQQWQWHGPFTASQIRLVKAPGQLDAGNYLSPLGNLFVTVVAYDTSSVDIVSLTAHPITEGNAALPPAPSTFSVTAEHGGLLLEWTAGMVADLAGYRVMWSSNSFGAASDAGVQTANYAETGGRHLLALPQRLTYVAIQTVDIAGNVSPLSKVLNAVPLAGTPPPLTVTISAPSCLQDATVTLWARGASSYDYDLDGDGVYDVTGDTTGTPRVDTSRTGIGRFSVRGHGSDGQSLALAGVSLMVTSSARPTLAATAQPQTGMAPLLVNFAAMVQTDEFSPPFTYAWDFDGDGIYEAGTNFASIQHTYIAPGTFNAGVRVINSAGAWAAYPVVITVVPKAPTASFTVEAQPGFSLTQLRYSFDGSASSDPSGGPLRFDWDFDGDGLYDVLQGPAVLDHVYPSLGTYLAQLRVTDAAGVSATQAHYVYAQSVWSSFHGQPGSYTRQSPVIAAQIMQLKWSYATGSPVYSSPAIGLDGTVYIGSDNHKVYALADNGSATPTVRWSYTTGAQVNSSPALGPDGTVYIGSYDKKLYALVDNGTTSPTLKWSYTFGTPMQSSAILGPDGTVYAGCNAVYAFMDNGTPTPTVKWRSGWAPISSNPALGPDGTLYSGSVYFDANRQEYNLYAYKDAATTSPSVKWQYATADSIYSSPALGADGTVYVGSEDAKLYAFKDNGTNTPTVKWAYATGAGVHSSPAVGADGTIYFGSEDGNVYALKDNGVAAPTVKWSYTTNAAVYSSPAVGADGTVYIGSYDHRIYALKANGTSTPTVKWSYQTGAGIYSSPAIASDGTVYVGSIDGTVYAFGP